jgi:hypothetical protein
VRGCFANYHANFSPLMDFVRIFELIVMTVKLDEKVFERNDELMSFEADAGLMRRFDELCCFPDEL